MTVRAQRMTEVFGPGTPTDDGLIRWDLPGLSLEFTPESFRELPTWGYEIVRRRDSGVSEFDEYTEDAFDGEALEVVLGMIDMTDMTGVEKYKLDGLWGVFGGSYTDDELRPYFEHAVEKGWRVGGDGWWDQPSDVKMADLPVSEAARLAMAGYDADNLPPGFDKA